MLDTARNVGQIERSKCKLKAYPYGFHDGTKTIRYCVNGVQVCVPNLSVLQNIVKTTAVTFIVAFSSF